MPQNVLYRGVTSLHGLGTGVPLYLPPPPRPKHYAPHMGICLGRGGGGRRMRAVDGGDEGPPTVGVLAAELRSVEAAV